MQLLIYGDDSSWGRPPGRGTGSPARRGDPGLARALRRAEGVGSNYAKGSSMGGAPQGSFQCATGSRPSRTGAVPPRRRRSLGGAPPALLISTRRSASPPCVARGTARDGLASSRGARRRHGHESRSGRPAPPSGIARGRSLREQIPFLRRSGTVEQVFREEWVMRWRSSRASSATSSSPRTRCRTASRSHSSAGRPWPAPRRLDRHDGTQPRDRPDPGARRCSSARQSSSGVSRSFPPRRDDVSAIPDERLVFFFTCCHPALSAESCVAPPCARSGDSRWVRFRVFFSRRRARQWPAARAGPAQQTPGRRGAVPRPAGSPPARRAPSGGSQCSHLVFNHPTRRPRDPTSSGTTCATRRSASGTPSPC